MRLPVFGRRLPAFVVLFAAAFVLAACGGGAPERQLSGPGPRYKIGDPYQINGVWYYPREDYYYKETGVASWYGEAFHGKQTANGEIFDRTQVSAAHRTLPMPSIVRVTNLENGRSMVVRVNDRGPYVNNRIIDLSRRGAQLLGFDGVGTTRVRVEILPNESRAIADQMRAEGLAELTAQQRRLSRNRPDLLAHSANIGPAGVMPAAYKAAIETTVPNTEAVDDVPVQPTRIFVQAGAFADKAKADALAAKLRRLGQPQVSAGKAGGKTVYRVRLGPVRSVGEGERLMARVQAAGGGQARVVIE